MDKIWDRKCFEIGGHWPLMKKRMTTQKQQKSNARKKKFHGKWLRLYVHYCLNHISIITYV